MQIDITTLIEDDQFPLSHSRAEGGENAGAETWRASMNRAAEKVLLDTQEKLQAFRDWLKPWGAWSEEEISAMSDQHLNALFLQWVAGDCREAGADSLDEIDWQEYEARAEAGQCSANLCKDNEGKIWFSLCH